VGSDDLLGRVACITATHHQRPRNCLEVGYLESWRDGSRVLSGRGNAARRFEVAVTLLKPMTLRSIKGRGKKAVNVVEAAEIMRTTSGSGECAIQTASEQAD